MTQSRTYDFGNFPTLEVLEAAAMATGDLVLLATEDDPKRLEQIARNLTREGYKLSEVTGLPIWQLAKVTERLTGIPPYAVPSARTEASTGQGKRATRVRERKTRERPSR